jgi:hypothetical protein
MYCTSCQSGNQAEFTVEIMIHFSGLRNIDKPGVLAFPKVSVCLDCGFSQFTTPETALTLLATSETSSRRRNVGEVALSRRIGLGA